LRLIKHGGSAFWYGLLGLVLLAAPWWASDYVMSQLHFILIYSIVGFGLMMLVGFTGQISLGHAAFLAVGAYTEALMQAAGVPFFVSIATIAFNVIVEEIIARWTKLTGGNEGKHLKPVEILGWKLDSDAEFYFL